HTHLMNYPAGASLVLQEIGVLNGILIAPFQLMLDKPHGLILGYNLAIIFSFLVSGLGMYALAFDITRSRPAAFIAGIGFMLLPLRAMNVTTVNVLSTGWMPLYALFFSRTIRSPQARNILWTAVFFAFTLHTSNVYAFFLVLFSPIFILASLVADRKMVLNKRTALGLMFIAILCFLIILPNLIMIFITDISWEQPVDQADFFSANLVGYFFPSDQQMVYNYLFSLLPPFSYYISGVPGHATFVSFTLIVMFIYGIVKSTKKEITPWLITFAAFFVLSLGSRLHVWSWDTGVRLPYYLLMKYMPLSSAMRTPSRFVMLERVALLVVAAWGMKSLFSPSNNSMAEGVSESGNRNRWRTLFLPVVLALLVTAELWHIPFKYVEADVPEIYFEIAENDEEFAVADVPVKRYRDRAKYMFYQTVHGKPIPAGIVNRPEAGLEDTTGEIISLLSDTRNINPESLELLRRYGAGYVITHSFQNGRDSVVVHNLREH
ncbi:MAG: hypothetical protein HQ583_09475, partial [Candidatus Abyssubacteria bacterium]|nr:hypothetical protein [Candidatus Abyssubacteria bacterium]